MASALNSKSIEETKAIFKIVEKEINEDKIPNVASVNKVAISNNHFNPDPNNMFKRSSQAVGETISEGKKARVSVPIVSQSNSYSGSYGGNTTKLHVCDKNFSSLSSKGFGQWRFRVVPYAYEKDQV